MIRNLCLALAASLAVAVTPAVAAKITYSGTGTVSRVQGSLAPTGTAPVGSALDFSFDFDTDDATLYDMNEVEAAYDLPVTGFSATIGDYDFTPSSDPLLVPTLVLYYAFVPLGGPTTDRVLVADLYLAGIVQPTGSTASPFPIAPGAFDTLVLSAKFLAGDTDTALGFDQFRDPALAARRDFSYRVNNRVTGRFGQLSGTFAGGFSTATAVPEPATWAMTLLGFALLAAALRSARLRRLPREAVFARN